MALALPLVGQLLEPVGLRLLPGLFGLLLAFLLGLLPLERLAGLLLAQLGQLLRLGRDGFGFPGLRLTP